MDAKQHQAASDLLWRHWREGDVMAALPDGLRPTTRRDGYAIQALLERRCAQPLFGWKIAATSRAGQTHIGVDGPLAGRLLAERVCQDAGTAPLGANRMRVAEAEFAFRIGGDLPPRSKPYCLNEVLAAVDTLHPAIEVPDSRYEDFATVGAPQLIADNACAHQFVLGPPAPDLWRRLDLASHEARASADGGAQHIGTGANVLDGPLSALTWLAGELSRLGIPLRAGQVVTTGTCLEPLPIGPGAQVFADFGVLGSVSLRFGER